MVKRPEYVIRVTPEIVRIEHRTQGWYVWLLPLWILIGFCITRDSNAIAFGIVLAVAFLAVGMWRGILAESLTCDAREVKIARRAFFGHWKRQVLKAAVVTRLRRDVRNEGRNVTPYLMFSVGQVSFQLFAGIRITDAEEVLRGCAALGIDVIIDPDTAMLKDIEERGWLQNPYRPDR